MSEVSNSTGFYSIVLYKSKNNGENGSGGNNGDWAADYALFYRAYATTEAREHWITQMHLSGTKLVKIWGGLSERAYLNALSVLNRSPLRKESLERIIQNVTKEVRNAKMLKRKLR